MQPHESLVSGPSSQRAETTRLRHLTSPAQVDDEADISGRYQDRILDHTGEGRRTLPPNFVLERTYTLRALREAGTSHFHVCHLGSGLCAYPKQRAPGCSLQVTRVAQDGLTPKRKQNKEKTNLIGIAGTLSNVPRGAPFRSRELHKMVRDPSRPDPQPAAPTPARRLRRSHELHKMVRGRKPADWGSGRGVGAAGRLSNE